MSKLFISSLMFVFLSFSSNTYADEDPRLFLKLEDTNVSFAGFVGAVGDWIIKEYKVCTTKNTFLIYSEDGPGDPDSVGCYILYGPANARQTQWEIQTFIIENKNKSYGFTFELLFDGRKFDVKTFFSNGLNMNNDQAKKMFAEIFKIALTKNFQGLSYLDL